MTKQTDKATTRPLFMVQNKLNYVKISRNEYDALNTVATAAKNYQSHCFLYGINDTRTLKMGTLLEDALSNLGTIWGRNMK